MEERKVSVWLRDINKTVTCIIFYAQFSFRTNVHLSKFSSRRVMPGSRDISGRENYASILLQHISGSITKQSKSILVLRHTL